MVPFNMGMFLQLKVSFKMGTFSDTQHTHPGIFILESPPRGVVAEGTHAIDIIITPSRTIDNT